MRIRSARTLPVAAAVAATVTGSLSWAPTASAQSTDPTPSASTSSTPRNAAEPETGGVAILKKDPGGDVLAGASFTLFDSAGKEAANGKTDAQGKLAFTDIAPGVYRLKEISSGSALHDTVDDQDVIVTPGTDTPLTIVDPFKSASLLLKAKDDKTGKLLAGSTVNIGSGDTTILTLTTGSDGTASGILPISSRTGGTFWVKQVKAPTGYEIYTSAKTFKAKPGDPVTVTITNAKKTSGTTPAPTSSEKPTNTATAPGDTASGGTAASSAGSPTTGAGSSPTADASDRATSKAAAVGSLAHTGADVSPWLVGGAGLLVASGIGTIVAARARRSGSDATTLSGED
ncbi:SpaA isopeptide-forming pilin-related protein [Streptomyces brasiliscabiei]|uniref:SpaA isopeptide-forming pilin-related protein n=1 Tax=Streptomyces brasiliscabiei TaxID=2736302 RepID=UPI001C101D18|nr:SpaA isopeptide-forming pilin-related protein [Streptomyces brasiliscabiei]